MHDETDQMKLTAYALGELAGAEREAIAARLRDSADDLRHVEEVRATAEAISEALAEEETAGLDAIHYAAIELRLRDAGGARRVDRGATVRGRIGLALSIAASVVIVFGAIGFVMFSLLRHATVAMDVPRSSAHEPVLIPLESLPSEPAPKTPAFVGVAPNDADPFTDVAQSPVSSFAMNTDTASYEDLSRALSESHLPPRDSIKIEGLVNAFAYGDPAPAAAAPFGAGIEIARCPWTPAHRLARIQVKARPGEGTVAEDARTEVAFNPASAKAYRLLGYAGDAVSGKPAAGERVAAGQAVTALYEIIPVAGVAPASDLLTLRVRFRPSADAPEQTIQFTGRDSNTPPDAASADFRFASAVAEFGMVLRDSPGRGRSSMGAVIALAKAGRGSDPAGERQRFIELAERAKALLG